MNRFQGLSASASLLLAALALANCVKEDAAVGPNPSSEPKLMVRVLDAGASGPLEHAFASWEGGEPSETDENGFARLTGSPGAGVLRIFRDGYAEIQVTLPEGTAAMGDGSGADRIAYQEMHKQGVSLRGYLNRPAVGDKPPGPASGIQVILSLPEKFRYSDFTVFTDSVGEYAFENLPEATSFRLSVASTEVPGGVFSLPTRNLPPWQYRAGKEYLLPVWTLMPEGSVPFLEAEPPLDTRPHGHEPLQVRFSQPVDTAELTGTWINLDTEGNHLDLVTSWSMENTHLRIFLRNGEWGSLSRFTLTISGVTDIHGGVLAEPIVVRPPPDILPKVDSLWTDGPVDWTDFGYELVWNKVASAESYEIFQRTSPTAAFQSLKINDGDTSQVIPILKRSPNVRLWVQHLVLPISGAGVADMAEAETLTVEDRVSSLYERNAVALISTDFDNRMNSTPMRFTLDFTLAPSRDWNQPQYLQDVLDTTLVPVVTSQTNPCDEEARFEVEDPEVAWTGLWSGRITVTIPPGKHIMNTGFFLDHRSIRDLGGNPPLNQGPIFLGRVQCRP